RDGDANDRGRVCRPRGMSLSLAACVARRVQQGWLLSGSRGDRPSVRAARGFRPGRPLRSLAASILHRAEGRDSACPHRAPCRRRSARSGGDLRRMTIEVRRIDDQLWEIPRHGTMRVAGRIYATARQIEALRSDPCLQQIVNVAHLPGIVGHALAMPDIHWGYGFPIGGVAAVDAEEGAISPGGIGFDINCGVRLLRTGLDADELAPRLGRLADALYQAIPAGV